MNIRRAFIFAASIALLLGGCTTTPGERHLERLLRHRDWPRIEQIARAEVKKREKLLGWPGTASYLPQEHKDKIWNVMAMTATSNGDAQRVVSLMIGDDGAVLAYKRYWEGQELPELDQRR